jgi:hypothetical protein
MPDLWVNETLHFFLTPFKKRFDEKNFTSFCEIALHPLAHGKQGQHIAYIAVA